MHASLVKQIKTICKLIISQVKSCSNLKLNRRPTIILFLKFLQAFDICDWFEFDLATNEKSWEQDQITTQFVLSSQWVHDLTSTEAFNQSDKHGRGHIGTSMTGQHQKLHHAPLR